MQDVIKAVEEYLDSMPPLSRTTLPDLVTVVMGRVDGVTKGYRPKTIREIARFIASNRKDLMIMRQKGICKWNKP